MPAKNGLMNLLVATNLFPDTKEPWRGLDNATLVHAMRQQDPGLNVRVLAFRPSFKRWGAAPLKPRPEDASLQPQYFWAPYVPRMGGMNHRLFSFAFARALKALPRDFTPEAVLVPWLFPDACGVVLQAAAWGVPMVAVAQGSDVHGYLNMPMRRRAIMAMTRGISAIVTRSNDLEKRLAKQGADERKVHTVYNGVDIHTFKPASRAAARDELQVPQEGKVLLFVGNFLPVKGLDLLLAAFAQVVASSAQPVRLALIGGGPLEEALRAQAAQLNITDKVHFLGRHGASQVARWMQAADAVCLTSHNEGVPNVVLEAISSGRAPVCTDVGGISEVVEPVLGKRFLVPKREASAYAAALLDVLANPPDEGMLHEAARGYAWEKCAQQYLTLLRGKA
ncbi:glycosyltransferase [Prosthecobacter sp.]|uniref:glycosyltransferase n=1 Tax=Prosthecobacter sp. TaxID=1965333 RepID=UPI0037843819